MVRFPRVCRDPKCMALNRPAAKFCNRCRYPIPTAVEIFFSYAHEDTALRDKLATHLVMMQRNGLITTWYDQDINAGEDWQHAINTHLLMAEIILLLVSPDFLASDYCYSVEVQRAMDRQSRNQAGVIPVILRHTDWHQAPFGVLQALPTGAKPVKSWSNKDEALLDVVKGIKRAIDGP
jgi:hypothetical protein